MPFGTRETVPRDSPKHLLHALKHADTSKARRRQRCWESATTPMRVGNGLRYGTLLSDETARLGRSGHGTGRIRSAEERRMAKPVDPPSIWARAEP
jgi:hypothetical protein